MLNLKYTFIVVLCSIVFFKFFNKVVFKEHFRDWRGVEYTDEEISIERDYDDVKETPNKGFVRYSIKDRRF